MTDSKDNQIKTLLQINATLTSGLESTIVFLENYEKTNEEQRMNFIGQIRNLAKTSRDAFSPGQIH